jgi:hypothetical protein
MDRTRPWGKEKGTEGERVKEREGDEKGRGTGEMRRTEGGRRKEMVM